MRFGILGSLPPDEAKVIVAAALDDRIVLFEASNVAHLYYMDSPRDCWEPEHFPNCCSPWHEAWVEWETPSTVNQNGRINPGAAFSAASDILRIDLRKYPSPLAPEEIKRRLDEIITLERGSVPARQIPTYAISKGLATPGARWAQVFTTYVFGRKTGASPMFSHVVMLDERGDLIPDAQCISAGRSPFGPAIGPLSDGLDGIDKVELINFSEAHGLKPALLACSLVNVKNARIETELPILRRAQRRQAARIGEMAIARVRYSTVRIEAMSSFAKRQEQVHAEETAGRPQPLHIRRGHFKDYRNGAGLFGRIRGVFWWEQELRGDSTAGRIHKDYVAT